MGTLAGRRDSIHWSPYDDVWNNRQKKGDDDRVENVDPAQNNDLINAIEREGKDVDLADRTPTVGDQFPTHCRILAKLPKESGSPFTAVLQTATDCEECRHQRLEEKPEFQRPSGP